MQMQLANVERRLSKALGGSSHVPAARSYYGASLELLSKQLDPLASPNGEASLGSPRRKQLMPLVQFALRIIGSWAQMELDDG